MGRHAAPPTCMGYVVLVRYGELGLKGKNRPGFEDRLRDRLRAAVAPFPGARVVKAYGRMLVHLQADPEPAVARLRRVFGVVSLSPAVEAAPELPALREAARTAMAEALAARAGAPGEGRAGAPGTNGPVHFRVHTVRADKQFPMTSTELNADLGHLLREEFPHLQVDLKAWDLEVAVELREGRAYVYSRTIPGPGGLPYGSSGKACLLISGGIDSPVAGWLAMKRGVRLEPIHFHSFPFTSERAREKVLDLCKVLAGWGAPMKVHLVSLTEIQKDIRRHCPEPLHITILRRFMLRIADRLARQHQALALLTGESIGQVASQTLESMQTINEVTSLPVLRPLAGLDKTEVVAMARSIGTYELSILPYEDCCTLFVPRSPRTRPRPEEAHRAEAGLDVDALVQGALDQGEVAWVTATAVEPCRGGPGAS